jgi:hypothetical protein
MTLELRGWFAPADVYALRLLLLVSTVILLWQPVYSAQLTLPRCCQGRDPWGEHYRIQQDATGRFEVRCTGPDRRANTSDDIVRTWQQR